MMRVVDGRQRIGRCLVSCFGVVSAAMLMLSAVPSERASAMSLINPASAPTVKHVPDELLTEVRHGGGGYRGGGGGYRGGAVHFSGGGYRAAPAFRAGPAYRAGPAFHGGGVRYSAVRSSGYRYGGYRVGGYRFAHRHHFHRGRFFYGPSYYDDYPSYYYYPRHRCRVIWTYHGPRRVCRWHHRHRHHWRVYW
jgi:hypothetical protein